MDKDKNKSALKVNEGIEQPPQINEELLKKLPRRKRTHDAEWYVKKILEGDRTGLSQAITLVESALPEHQEIAQEIIEKCIPNSGQSIRIGITGVPGVGKSTFIEAFGTFLTGKGHKVAVLAIDPSSQRSKGSILGDKTRMEQLAVDPNAYVRPSPSAGSLGGVARKTRETVVLCEAAGFDVIIIETVGVGQSETAVHSMVDFFLLLMLAGAGDELQGIKRGIMEMADAIIINKADGDNIPKAIQAKAQYQSALHLFPPTPSGWTPRVETCSSLTGEGIDTVWQMMEDYFSLTHANGFFQINRNQQAVNLMTESLQEYLHQAVFGNPFVEKIFDQMKNAVVEGHISPYMAARKVFDACLNILRQE
ncbi:MAG: methylmalonyl Co-A mutase-associated GTPase MeaB [Bacteroidales bacterium]|jgi:LAO/AO transport system kinase|nr:methylmalonyl Co-A mutase-associated GTPase MeaB [Bacteroidales bacterium]NPV35537.1 methylmalonyl Co-A mutase-associated GTPase MeaB [Bacteroidales bacterium]